MPKITIERPEKENKNINIFDLDNLNSTRRS